MKKFILSFLLIITLVCNCPCVTYASGSLSGWDSWTNYEKFNWWTANLSSIAGSLVGIWVPNSQADIFSSICNTLYDETMKENSDETYEDWLCRHLGYNSETQEITMNDELTDFVYNASVQYIEENSGYRIVKTGDVVSLLNYIVAGFPTSKQYNVAKDYVKSLDSGKVLYFNSSGDFINNSITYTKSDGTSGRKFYFLVYDWDNITCTLTRQRDNYTWYIATFYDENWINCNVNYTKVMIDEDGNIEEEVLEKNSQSHFNIPGKTYNVYFQYVYEPDIVLTDTSLSLGNIGYGLYSNSGYIFRGYTSLADLKQYSVGQRPYYVGDKFVNYDSSVDNSTTITQTEIDNSITYGDVYNYIINNYDNPDGLTEEELRAILEEYLSQIGGGSGSGSGGGSGGSDDGGSSGGGLGSFLEGLGSIGDAILSILGKLLEYIGKALELLTGTVTKVLDLIPSNITNLLLGLFPFIPQEWVTAIELSLVLGVVLAVVGAFKK